MMPGKKIYFKNLSSLRKNHSSIFNDLQTSLSESVNGLENEDHSDFSFVVEQMYKSSGIGEKRSNLNSLNQILHSINKGMDFLYLLGLDADMLLKCYAEIVKENRGIIIIEPNIDVLHSVLVNSDVRTLFWSNKIFWALGRDVDKQIIQIMKTTLCYAAAQPRFHFGRKITSDGEHAYFNELLNFLKHEIRERKSSITQKLKSLPDILKPEPEGKPRIWSYQDLRRRARYSLIQHVLMRTFMFYFRRMGYETEYTVLHQDHYYPPYYRLLKMALFEPNLIFLCNESPAFEFVLGREFSRSLPIPKVIWFADDPLYGEHLFKRHKISTDETYLIADYEWADTLKMHGANSVDYLPGAATKIRRGRKRASRFCEVVFVGQVRDQSAFLNQLSPSWRDYCHRVISEKLRFPRKKVRDAMAQFQVPNPISDDRMDEFRQKLLWEANTQFRLNIIRALAGFDIRIYGNEDWLKLLPPKLAEQCYFGLLSFKHLFEVYRNSKITLNIHSLQSYTCMNVRDFDVPAAGGFLISDWLPKADEVYRPGFVSDLPLDEESDQEVFFYRSIPELIQLTEYFLEHEHHRRACIERARDKVMEGHTYLHRAEKLNCLFQSLMVDR